MPHGDNLHSDSKREDSGNAQCILIQEVILRHSIYCKSRDFANLFRMQGRSDGVLEFDLSLQVGENYRMDELRRKKGFQDSIVCHEFDI